MKARIQLSDHFTYTKLIRFVIPSIMTMIFTSIYGVVDGLFVSNFVGKTPFAAINLIYPVLTILGAVGFMLGTGGTAIVGKTLGEGKPKQANEYFSMITWIAIAVGIFLAVIGFIFLPMLSRMLGAKENMIADCVLYGKIIMIALPLYLLQNMFQSYLVVAEKPKLALAVTVMSGLTNIIFDALFIVGFQWGITGAALATALSQAVGGLVPFFYFLNKNSSLLRLTKLRFHGRILLNACINGSSEMVSNLAAAFINMLLNWQLMRLAGENGVAAFGVIMYVSFIFSAIFYGYAIGSAPIVSYHYGADDTAEVKNLLHKSLRLTFWTGIFMMLAVLLLAEPLTRIFVGYDEALVDMTVHAFHVYLITFFFAGFNVFGSAFFTALNDGKISAFLSFSRTLLLQGGAALILPIFLKIDGVWWAGVMADLLAMIMTFFFLYKKRQKYRYA